MAPNFNGPAECVQQGGSIWNPVNITCDTHMDSDNINYRSSNDRLAWFAEPPRADRDTETPQHKDILGN